MFLKSVNMYIDEHFPFPIVPYSSSTLAVQPTRQTKELACFDSYVCVCVCLYLWVGVHANIPSLVTHKLHATHTHLYFYFSCRFLIDAEQGHESQPKSTYRAPRHRKSFSCRVSIDPLITWVADTLTCAPQTAKGLSLSIYLSALFSPYARTADNPFSWNRVKTERRLTWQCIVESIGTIMMSISGPKLAPFVVKKHQKVSRCVDVVSCLC